MVPNHVPNKMKHTEFCVLHKQGCRQCSLKLPQIERPMFDLDRNYAVLLRFYSTNVLRLVSELVLYKQQIRG